MLKKYWSNWKESCSFLSLVSLTHSSCISNPISRSPSKASPLPPSSQCPPLPVCRDEWRLSSELLQWRKHTPAPCPEKQLPSFRRPIARLSSWPFVTSPVKVQDTIMWLRVAQCRAVAGRMHVSACVYVCTCTSVHCTSSLLLTADVCHTVDHTAKMYMLWHRSQISSWHVRLNTLFFPVNPAMILIWRSQKRICDAFQIREAGLLRVY